MNKSMKENVPWPVAGHENVRRFLSKSIESGKVSHAYLFVGPRNVGKKTMASHFISSLLCHGEKAAVSPCGNCFGCKQFARNIHPDVFFVKRERDEKAEKMKKNISVEQMRELQNKLNMGSFLNSYKAALIEEAEALSLSAANSLLKTLEEPAKKTVLILLAETISSVIPTVVSRCQVVRFYPVAKEDIYRYLLDRGSERKQVDEFASLCAGRPGLAIGFKDNPRLFEEYKARVEMFFDLFKSDMPGRFRSASSLANENDLDDILNIWMSVVRDANLIKIGSNDRIINAFSITKLRLLASRFEADHFKKWTDSLRQARSDISANVNKKLVLENFILNVY